MRELHLYAGAGGGILGGILLGHDIIGAVEIDPYCQQVLAQRQADGILPSFPIFADVHAFISSGSAALYRGVTDVLAAGVPCQIASVAGKRDTSDARNLWPETIEAIDLIRPRYAFLENVPGLLSVQCVGGTRIHRGVCDATEPHNFFGHVLAGLSAIGYDCIWTCLSAADVGAPHLRTRLWILAYPRSGGCRSAGEQGSMGTVPERWANDASEIAESGQAVADSDEHSGEIRGNDRPNASHCGFRADHDRGSGSHDLGITDAKSDADMAHAEWLRSRQRTQRQRAGQSGQPIDVADSECGRCKQCDSGQRTVSESDTRGAELADSGEYGLEGRRRNRNDAGQVGLCNGAGSNQEQCICESAPWAHFGECEDARLARSGIRRVSDGISQRVAKLRALGNAQVPLQAATAFQLLLSSLAGNE